MKQSTKAIFLVILSSAFLIYVGYRTVDTIYLIATGTETKGKVTGLKCAPVTNFDKTGSVKVLCNLTVSFIDSNGQQHSFEGDILASEAAHPKGSKVNVIYSQGRHLSASINTFKSLWLGNIIFFAIGSVILALSYIGRIVYREEGR